MAQGVAAQSTALGDPEQLLDAAIQRAKESGDAATRVGALHHLGGYRMVQGHYGDALTLLSEAIELGATLDDFDLTGLLADRSFAALFDDNVILALRSAEDAVQQLRQEIIGGYFAHFAHALALAAVGEPGMGAESLAPAIEHARRASIPLLAGDCVIAAAGHALYTGDPKRAAKLLGAARAIFGLTGSWRTPAGGAMYVFFGRRVRNAIPPEVVERARTEGKGMTQDQALDFALEGLRPSNP